MSPPPQPGDSAETLAPHGRVNWDGWKIALMVLIPITASTVSLLWAHEGRLVTVEVRAERVAEDLTEIKSDVKKLLEK
jgi:hypothetical protein